MLIGCLSQTKGQIGVIQTKGPHGPNTKEDHKKDNHSNRVFSSCSHIALNYLSLALHLCQAHENLTASYSDEQEVDAGATEKVVEKVIVTTTNTIPCPGTVMIEAVHAIITIATVLRTGRAINIARFTQFPVQW
jgi:hypothetical protein